jgi:hypothetical protein
MRPAAQGKIWKIRKSVFASCVRSGLDLKEKSVHSGNYYGRAVSDPRFAMSCGPPPCPAHLNRPVRVEIANGNAASPDKRITADRLGGESASLHRWHRQKEEEQRGQHREQHEPPAWIDLAGSFDVEQTGYLKANGSENG